MTFKNLENINPIIMSVLAYLSKFSLGTVAFSLMAANPCVAAATPIPTMELSLAAAAPTAALTGVFQEKILSLRNVESILDKNEANYKKLAIFLDYNALVGQWRDVENVTLRCIGSTYVRKTYAHIFNASNFNKSHQKILDRESVKYRSFEEPKLINATIKQLKKRGAHVYVCLGQDKDANREKLLHELGFSKADSMPNKATDIANFLVGPKCESISQFAFIGHSEEFSLKHFSKNGFNGKSIEKTYTIEHTFIQEFLDSAMKLEIAYVDAIKKKIGVKSAATALTAAIKAFEEKILKKEAERIAAEIAAIEEAAKIAAEAETAKIAAIKEAARIAEKEEAARIAAEKAIKEEAAKIAAIEEATRVAAETEYTRRAKEEAAKEFARRAAARVEAETLAQSAARYNASNNDPVHGISATTHRQPSRPDAPHNQPHRPIHYIISVITHHQPSRPEDAPHNQPHGHHMQGISVMTHHQPHSSMHGISNASQSTSWPYAWNINNAPQSIPSPYVAFSYAHLPTPSLSEHLPGGLHQGNAYP